MRALAGFLSLLIALPIISYGQTAANSVVVSQEESEAPTSTATTLAPLTVTAQRLHEEEEARIHRLKRTRMAGGVMAGTGVGLMINAVIVGIGSTVALWAMPLILVGGLTAYFAHRKLKGKNDFGPTTNQPAFPPSPAPSNQPPYPTDQPYGR